MLNENTTELAKEIIKTQPPNRPWVLSLIINVLLFAAVLYCISREKKERDEKIVAERELALERANSLKEGKECTKAILESERKVRAEYEQELKIQRAAYELELKRQIEKAEIFDNRVNALVKKARKLETETRTIHSKLKPER